MNEAQFRDPGEVPVLDWVDKSLIDVDPAYQRRPDEGRVQRILDWFEWSSFGAIVVAPSGDGRFHVTDGQHRLEAARRHPAITVVPAVIIPKSGTTEEAGNFVVLNVERRNISQLDRYWAELAAEDPDALTVKQVCERAGVTICRYPGAEYRPAETVAVSAIRAVIDKRGAMRAREILQVVAKAECAPIRGEQIRAAEVLLTDEEFRDDVEADALTDALAGNTDEIASEAKAFAKTHRLTVTRAYASVWFRRSRKKRKAA